MSTYTKRYSACINDADKRGKAHWQTIGVAFEREKDGRTMLSVKLFALPTLGEFVLFEHVPKDDRDGPKSEPRNPAPQREDKLPRGGRR